MQQSIFSLHTVNRHFLLPPFLSGARSSWASLRISRTILGYSTRTPSSVVEREIPASQRSWMPLPATTTLASVSSRSSVQSGWGSSFALLIHFLNTIYHSKKYFSNQKRFKSARMTWNQALSWPLWCYIGCSVRSLEVLCSTLELASVELYLSVLQGPLAQWESVSFQRSTVASVGFNTPSGESLLKVIRSIRVGFMFCIS